MSQNRPRIRLVKKLLISGAVSKSIRPHLKLNLRILGKAATFTTHQVTMAM